MPTAKDCHTLSSYFIKVSTDTYGYAPVINRHSARWGFDSILLDLSVNEVKELIDYYFTTASAKRHSLDGFLYNYEKLAENKKASQEDAERRKRLTQESYERARKWRERGNQGITNA